MPAPILPFTRGSVQTAGVLASLLGSQYEAFDISLTKSGGIYPLRSSRTVKLQYVTNGDSAAILPCAHVKYLSGSAGTSVVTAGLADIADGVADEWLPAAGVPVGGGFYIVIDGPTTLISDGSSTLSQGLVLVTAAAGEVKKQVAAPADATAAIIQVNSRVGQCEATVAATAHIKFLGYFRRGA